MRLMRRFVTAFNRTFRASLLATIFCLRRQLFQPCLGLQSVQDVRHGDRAILKNFEVWKSSEHRFLVLLAETTNQRPTKTSEVEKALTWATSLVRFRHPSLLLELAVLRDALTEEEIDFIEFYEPFFLKYQNTYDDLLLLGGTLREPQEVAAVLDQAQLDLARVSNALLLTFAEFQNPARSWNTAHAIRPPVSSFGADASDYIDDSELQPRRKPKPDRESKLAKLLTRLSTAAVYDACLRMTSAPYSEAAPNSSPAPTSTRGTESANCSSYASSS